MMRTMEHRTKTITLDERWSAVDKWAESGAGAAELPTENEGKGEQYKKWHDPQD
jgi:hypothetical protein